MLAPTHPAQLVLGLTVWSIWFVAWYGGLSVACQMAPPDPGAGALTWINLSLLLITLVTLVPLLYWARRCWRASADASPQGRFIARVAAGGHLLAAGATLVMVLPTLVLPPCV